MGDRTCTVEGCDSKMLARGWCSKHWQRWRNGGDPNIPSARELSPAQRFWAKVQKTETCWLWTAGKDWDGYGIFSDAGRTSMRAHRWAYIHEVGPIPDGLTLDHLCRVTSCVNPSHLEPVTSSENTSRSPYTLATQNAAKSHCPSGHPFDGVRANGERVCLTCGAWESRRYRGWGEESAQAAPVAIKPSDRTHCPQGHEYSEANTYRHAGSRHCRACHRARQRVRDSKRRSRRAEGSELPTGEYVRAEGSLQTHRADG